MPSATTRNQYDEAEELEIALCRTDLAAFIEKTFKIVSPGEEYLHNWHIEAISEYLLACERGEINRLIINIPPRSLKSVSVTVSWPAWLLGQDPSRKIMAASYSGLLSVKHSVDCRHLIESPFYQKLFPKTRLADDNNQKTKYITTARGHRIATSVGGTSTGEGGNFLILDDPHSAAEAQSKKIRESQLAWYDQSWSTRLNDKKHGVQVVVMQRLHEKDMTGHLLELGNWEHLCLPAIAPTNRTISIGKFKKEIKAGDILHEDREDKKSLDLLRRQMGTYAFAGQYMQTPAPEGGGIFKREWIKLFPRSKPLPKFEFIIQSYDTALSEQTSADFTAFLALGIYDSGKEGMKALLLDAWQEQIAYPDLRRKARQEFQTRYGEGEGRKTDLIIVEKKGSGISLLQDLRKLKLPFHEYNPGKADKVQRAHIVSYLIENGLLEFPESERSVGRTYEWAEEIIEQLTTFPNAEHDDYVDALTQALRYFRDADWLSVPEDPEEEDYEDQLPAVNPYGV